MVTLLSADASSDSSESRQCVPQGFPLKLPRWQFPLSPVGFTQPPNLHHAPCCPALLPLHPAACLSVPKCTLQHQGCLSRSEGRTLKSRQPVSSRQLCWVPSPRERTIIGRKLRLPACFPQPKLKFSVCESQGLSSHQN